MLIKLVSLTLCLSFSVPAMAFDVIGPFPAPGSTEEINDFTTLLEYQNTRTAEQCAIAQNESDASLKVFFGKLLSASELDRAQSKLKWLTVKTGAKILIQKQKYRRPRPYESHPEIKPCIDLEGSKAYPSGHTTLARVYARVLSVMHPERSELFMRRSDEASLNRVIGGVHHPSDVVAGKILGDAIADDYLGVGDNFYNLISIN